MLSKLSPRYQPVSYSLPSVVASPSSTLSKALRPLVPRNAYPFALDFHTSAAKTLSYSIHKLTYSGDSNPSLVSILPEEKPFARSSRPLYSPSAALLQVLLHHSAHRRSLSLSGLASFLSMSPNFGRVKCYWISVVRTLWAPGIRSEIHWRQFDRASRTRSFQYWNA